MTKQEYILKVYRNVKLMRDRAMQMEMQEQQKPAPTIIEQIQKEQEIMISKARAAAFQDVVTMMRELDKEYRGESKDEEESI